ncbi:dipeptidase [Amycolatopsis jejuensis]|uniref:dipeptidase n=1 Tax=Amycolatopsis jejuensis TaxID=330084 RepID=UPI00068EDAA9|nr:membrane dipeptidase [Amycolatopsis jejuensis]
MAVSAQETVSTTDLYRDAIVVDASIAPRMDEAQIERMTAAGVTAVNWTVCSPHAEFEAALAEIAAGLEVIERHADRLLLVRRVADIAEAKRTGRVAVILGPQNLRPAHPGKFAIRVLSELNVRICQLTYNERNLYGDGAAEPADAGLSVAGRDAIEEMNRLRMVVDISHCGDRTTREAIDASAHPVVITHANARALHPSPRNKTDGHLRALAARGGVIGLALWSPMLRFDRWPDVGDFVTHVKYVADLIGPEHVGIGTDHNESADLEEWTRNSSRGSGRYQSVTGRMGDWYTYETRCARGGSSVLNLPAVTEAIAASGFTSEEMKGILGGNFLRVFGAVWGS